MKLLKTAKGIRSLLKTVMKALPQVGNLSLLFLLLFFMFAALGVELFGRIGTTYCIFVYYLSFIGNATIFKKLLECSDDHPCDAMDEHASFVNFGMAFLTLFRVATGDNWSGIMEDTLRPDCDASVDCVKNCCVSNTTSIVYFVIFVLISQFVLVNIVIAVLMDKLEESNQKVKNTIFKL